MIPMHAHRLHPPAQEGLRDGVPIDAQIHGLPHALVHQGHLRVELVRAGKVQPTEQPLMLDSRQLCS